MPELPEVEAIARTLRPIVRSQLIRCVHVFHPLVTRPQAASQLVKDCQDRRVRDVWRRGKYCFYSSIAACLRCTFALMVTLSGS